MQPSTTSRHTSGRRWALWHCWRPPKLVTRLGQQLPGWRRDGCERGLRGSEMSAAGCPCCWLCARAVAETARQFAGLALPELRHSGQSVGTGLRRWNVGKACENELSLVCGKRMRLLLQFQLWQRRLSGGCQAQLQRRQFKIEAGAQLRFKLHLGSFFDKNMNGSNYLKGNIFRDMLMIFSDFWSVG